MTINVSLRKGDYTIRRTLSKMVVVLEHYKWGRQLWIQIIPRKVHYCRLCKARIEGKSCFRPLTNSNNRGRRICTQCISNLQDTLALLEKAWEMKELP